MRNLHRWPSSRQNGQALVLWVMTLLLMTLMVLGTLSLGHRIRERQELQNIADVAAYNQAVVVARTYNFLAMANRGGAAAGVVIAGAASLESYAGFGRMTLAQAKLTLGKVQKSYQSCCDADGGVDPVTGAVEPSCPARGCACGEATRMQTVVDQIDTYMNAPDKLNLPNLWHPQDQLAGMQMKNMVPRLKLARVSMEAIQAGLRRIMGAAGDGPGDYLTTSVIQAAQSPQEKAREEIIAPFDHEPAPTISNKRQKQWETALHVGGDEDIYTGGSQGKVVPRVSAIMAARPNSFVTQREQAKSELQALLAQALGPYAADVALTVEQATGSAGYGQEMEPSIDFRGAKPGSSWAPDEGALRAVWGVQCLAPGYADAPNPDSGSVGYTAWMKTAGLWDQAAAGTGDSEHVYDIQDDPSPREVHNAGSQFGSGMLADSTELSERAVADPSLLFGQPLLLSMVQRDFSRRDYSDPHNPPFPWDILVRSRFTPSSTASFTTRGMSTSEGVDLSQQIAMAGGMVYYHRAMRAVRTVPERPATLPAGAPWPPPSTVPYGQIESWREPPNLWNPFWRATLFIAGQQAYAGPGARNGAEDDRVRWLREYGFEQQASTYDLLYKAGYRGSK